MEMDEFSQMFNSASLMSNEHFFVLIFIMVNLIIIYASLIYIVQRVVLKNTKELSVICKGSNACSNKKMYFTGMTCDGVYSLVNTDDISSIQYSHDDERLVTLKSGVEMKATKNQIDNMIKNMRDDNIVCVYSKPHVSI